MFIAFLYTSNECIEFEIVNAIPYVSTNLSKWNIYKCNKIDRGIDLYLGIALTK